MTIINNVGLLPSAIVSISSNIGHNFSYIEDNSFHKYLLFGTSLFIIPVHGFPILCVMDLLVRILYGLKIELCMHATLLQQKKSQYNSKYDP